MHRDTDLRRRRATAPPMFGHNPAIMFVARWSWLGPLVGAMLVFSAVLLTTPPGLRAISDVLLGTPRGASADAAAYALGSAGSLALLTLVVLAMIFGALDFVLARKRSTN